MSYGNYNQNPYQQGPPAEAGYGYGQGPPQGQGQQEYEMSNYGQPTTMSQNDFLTRVSQIRDDIRSLTTDVEQIGALHQRALGSTDSSAGRSLESLVSQTQVRNTRIKDAIKNLERDVARTTDGSRATKVTQLNSLKKTFEAELRRYQSIESEYEQKYRAQIARQYRIVNPEASEEEVQQASNADWGNEGVFQTALRTNRTGQASSVLGAVRARHNELMRIEQTMNELAYLLNEVAALIDQHEPVVEAAQTNAQNAVENIHKGNQQVEIATASAARARRLKWWCFGIVVLILIIIGAIVGALVGLEKSGHPI